MTSVRVGDKYVYPTKIVCIGRNYLEHIKELNNVVPEQMVVFNKPPSAISPQLVAFDQEPLHYEAEMCFLIKDGAYTAVALGLDLTKRNLQSQLKANGLPWERAKGFDGSALFSRFVDLTGVEVDTLEIELLINCVRVQKGTVKQMIYSPHTILEELNTYTSLQDGDIIMTGTPPGVGEIHVGDVFLGRIKAGEKTLVEAEWLAE
ncbi:fumarylacetoacetate hydrolase family protein [Vibrio ostreicida]|uniref:Fumarylacetoacetate hydrolase family protein n=1 Tax=Vibrio ostreicida TaxID=526588 RepID=A0ABT8C287_9VIBR|nr:fumarylacetoacetate hydrolase family protein [Vibrio ostreicida]MDN3612457.1 fumarylacetoacetate hydrolase family protein [Vibrio ostreicida]NPD10167.1 fumarylacetoacetate hydrolase family protein [Vibrio ostreicida]